MWKAMTPKLSIHLKICLLLVVAVATPMTYADCKGTCGSVNITYPFGIGEGCYLNPWYEIGCSNNSKPFLSRFNIEILEVYPGPYVRTRMPPLYACSANDTQNQLLNSSIDLRGSPYNFPQDSNVMIMEGCQGNALLVDESNESMGGCATACRSSDNLTATTNTCYGVQCCQTEFALYPLNPQRYFPPLQFYQIYFNHQTSGDQNQQCLVATLIEKTAVHQYAGNLLTSSDESPYPPVVLRWSWPKGYHGHHKNPHATCYGDGGDSYYICYCDQNYNGNPYLRGGCKAPKGCEGCQGYCLTRLDGTGFYCKSRPLLNLAAILGLSNSFGLLLLVACLYGLYRFIKRRMELKRRAKFFKHNGGLLLQQQLSYNEGVVERTKIFSINELDKATNSFNENQILGRGGQGTVYKGMLTDGSIVAVKKSRVLDESQLEQFINEVVVLSRVNHRHVVKLFGCCLETEVPLLVYEFISNGTLYQHIHDPDEDFPISWKMRLKIAADSAGAIAYLHSSSAVPIYHRDIKSSNILLDERHRAKVSDFGSSKTIAIDQTHITTLVQGTMGYLDPEYFQSYQFTEKSDVYSFGVVLLELLTSKKPIYREAGTMEQKNLVTEFLFLTQSSRLSEILDTKVVAEAKEDELISVVELAKHCICWSGKLRPTMKEVVMTLEMIMKSPGEVSAWYQQQEAFPIQYEEFDMSDISGTDFMSITLPDGASSSLYTDENPLLSESI